MKGRTFHLVIEKDEDGYFVGEIPELPGCHSQAKTVLALRKRMKEAIAGYLEAGQPLQPGPTFVEVQSFEVCPPQTRLAPHSLREARAESAARIPHGF
jgi:predicted RNase H-like HicB family nuclease